MRGGDGDMDNASVDSAVGMSGCKGEGKQQCQWKGMRHMGCSKKEHRNQNIKSQPDIKINAQVLFCFFFLLSLIEN